MYENITTVTCRWTKERRLMPVLSMITHHCSRWCCSDMSLPDMADLTMSCLTAAANSCLPLQFSSA